MAIHSKISNYRHKGTTQTSKIGACCIRFNQQHIQILHDVIKHNTFLNIFTNSNICYLHKLKTYQALDNLAYKNLLFIGLESLMLRHKEILKL